MKSIYTLILILSSTFISCSSQTGAQSQKINRLSVEEFDSMLSQNGVQLVDVRTPKEYAGGHLKGAVNYNINSADFEANIGKLDKSKPVMVYCLAGGRSAEAASIMADLGFKTLYDMQGGIMRWSAAGKLLDTGNAENQTAGMTADDFNRQLQTDKYVLVDYNAEWCKPCKKMLPILEALAEQKKEKMILLRIDADENKALLQQKGIAGIPYLELYKDGKLLWKHEGAIDEATLLKETSL